MDSSRKSSLQPSNGARSRYLSGLTPEKQVEVLLKAERLGPAPNDEADWLVAQAAAQAAHDLGAAADNAAKRIEAASPMTDKALAAICERLERVEQGVDDLKKRPTAPSDLAPQMARLETLLRHGSQAADPYAAITRYVLAFGAGAAVCELLFAALFNRWMPPEFDRVGMFALGLSATAFVLLWLWLWPHVKATRR